MKGRIIGLFAAIGGALLVLCLFVFVISSRTALAETEATIRYVAPGGADGSNNCTLSTAPCATVQHAVATAGADDEVHVAAGVYSGTMVDLGIWDGISATVIISKQLTALRGGYSPDFSSQDPAIYETTLTAAGAEGAFVLFLHNTDVTVDGFVLTGAYAPRPANGSDYYYWGGGVSIANGQPILENNVIQDNYSRGPGGGIIVDHNARAMINANTIVSNTSADIDDNYWGGGGVFVWTGEVTVTDNLIAHNTVVTGAHGGGLWLREATGLIHGNTFYENHADFSGGAIAVVDNNATGSVEISENVIRDNVAQWGSGISLANLPNLDVMIERNEISHNRIVSVPWSAGGISASAISGTMRIVNNVVAENDLEGLEFTNVETAEIINNTFVDNGVRGIEAMAWPTPPTDAFTATLENNIIVGHTDCGVTAWTGVALLASYNNVWNNGDNFCAPPTGSHNISVDPEFIDANAGNYHVTFTAPVVDAGTVVGAPPIDKDGVSRPQGAGVDMGAYEVQVQTVFIPVIVRD